MRYLITVVIAAISLNVVGQGGNICEYPELLVPRVVFLDADSDGVWLSAQSDDPLIWDLGAIGDSLFVQECGTHSVRELVDIEGVGQLPCGFSEEVMVVTKECLESELEFELEFFCGEGTIYDFESGKCIVAIPSDSNFDGCVQLNDLLDLLGAYGDCIAEESPWQCGDPLEYQGYEYETVQIGDQCWFAENLRAENYRNGDVISSNLSDAQWNQWSSDDLGGSSVYGEDSGCNTASPTIDDCDPLQSLPAYGRLYNWYAVNDDRDLCPTGWHVPLHDEWSDLQSELGGSSAAEDAMKSINGWQWGSGGTNSSGFTALPGGKRNSSNGYFSFAGFAGMWWSSSTYSSLAWNRYLRANTSTLGSEYSDRGNGYSVRCLKD